MDMLYPRMLEVFEDGELHTYKEVWEKTLKDLYPLGWNKGSFQNLGNSGFIKEIDRGGPNRAIRYQITEHGREVLRIARMNQKVFNFLRHFKDKDKDDYFSAILKKELESGKAAEDLTPLGILKAFEALYSEEAREAWQIGNYEVYEKRLWNLISKTNALRNVELPMLYAGLPKGERRQRAEELLKLVEMGERMKHLPEELSGGQKQRVAIARAMANDPAIILADEPTGALDTKTGHLVMNLFHQLNEEQGKTIVLITHSPELARETDRMISIRDGNIESEEILKADRPYEKELLRLRAEGGASHVAG